MVRSGLRTHLHALRPHWAVTVSSVLTLKTARVSISIVSTTLVGTVKYRPAVLAVPEVRAHPAHQDLQIDPEDRDENV